MNQDHLTGAAWAMSLLAFALGVLLGLPFTAICGLGGMIGMAVLPWVSRYFAALSVRVSAGQSLTDRDWHYIKTGSYPDDEGGDTTP